MQMVERGNAARAFRMDDRKQRLIVDRSLADGEHYFGWEVADAAALDALAARLEQAGVAVRREPAALADQRCVRGLISLRRSRRQPAGGVPRRRDRRRAVPARAGDFRFPHRAARHGPRRC